MCFRPPQVLFKVTRLAAAKKLGAKQFIAVCPIELDNYAEPKITPFVIREDYETKAM